MDTDVAFPSGSTTSPGTSAIEAIQAAEFRVQSCVSVREKYKAKLRALVNVLLPQGQPQQQPQQQQQLYHTPLTVKATERKKQQARDALADRLRARATMPLGKELHVLGDWLLLYRAASVNVVESVVHWRRIVHSDRPLPFEAATSSHGHSGNYLLHMMDDVDFLDQSNDLVQWLGFRLVRNPFILRDHGGGGEGGGGDSPPHKEDKKKMRPSGPRSSPLPPASLVKPLIGILPEDDVVDGGRIKAALQVVVDEEALYGRSTTRQAVENYWVMHSITTPGADNDGDASECGNGSGSSMMTTLFDEIAEATKTLRRWQHKLTVLQRDHAKVSDLVETLEDQICLTTQHNQSDVAIRDHCVWKYRENCRQVTLRKTRASLDQLMNHKESLDAKIEKTQTTVATQQRRMDQLVHQKETKRRQRIEEKKRQQQQDEEADGGGLQERRNSSVLRQKTIERNRNFKAKRANKPKNVPLPGQQQGDEALAALTPAEQLLPHGDRDGGQESILTEEDLAAIGSPANNQDRTLELEKKRLEGLGRRDKQRIHHDQFVQDQERDRNRRRNENAAMFLEDRRSQSLEQHFRQSVQVKIHKERVQRLAKVPLFSTIQELGSGSSGCSGTDKKYRVSVYDHRGKGYAPLDGLRFVAYDPSCSRSFSLLLSNREYNSLGYGRTQDGLSAFCQWLVVIYEKRNRQFKLIWSGAPCPPPLRIREYDHTLLCVHKEGLRVQQQHPSSSYCLVDVYIRTSDCATLHVVTTSLDQNETTTEERTVAASQLLPTKSMQLCTEYKQHHGGGGGDGGGDGGHGHTYVSWLHTHAVTTSSMAFSSPVASASSTRRTRVYTGEILVSSTGGGDNQSRIKVHVYDVSSTEYELQFAPPTMTPLGNVPQPTTDVNVNVAVLLKQHVNPYAVRLPNSAFGDLLACLRVEEPQPPPDADAWSLASDHDPHHHQRRRWTVHVLPTWRTSLAKYVRAIRMAKFGCQIGKRFFLVIVTLVQQKTEFRAHLLFELMAISHHGESCGDSGDCSRQSLRASLSDFLRCSDTILWRKERGEPTHTETDVEPDSGCATCWTNQQLIDSASALVAADAGGYEGQDESSTSDWHGEQCASCDATQKERLEILHHHFFLPALEPPSAGSLDYLYYATCDVCGSVPPPIVVVVVAPMPIPREEQQQEPLDTFLSHYFPCFSFSIDDDSDHDPSTSHKVLSSLGHNRICIVRIPSPSHSGAFTVSRARAVMDRVRTRLLHRGHDGSEDSDRSIHVALVVHAQPELLLLSSQRVVELPSSDEAQEAAADVLDNALHNLSASISHIAEMAPVEMEIEIDPSTDAPSLHPDDQQLLLSFDSYLVSEALLVEATRILLMLQPETEWRIPGETVGASSWTTACAFLRDPRQLSMDFQTRLQGLVAMTPSMRNVLSAYATHSKWPTAIGDVRAPFQALLATVLHVLYVQQVIDSEGGWCGAAQKATTSSSIYELPNNVSIITERVAPSAIGF